MIRMKKQSIPLFLGLLLIGCMGAGDTPLPRTDWRETPLHFGLHVTPDPATNPIDPPERFTGFHVATDFEIFAREKNEDIPVRAVCDGDIVFAGFSEGYGGLVTQWCTLDGEDVTVIYGHLAVDSLPEKGTAMKTGQSLGILGAARSTDTDGSRKHLHLGIAKGHSSEVRGYVQSEEELDLFIDPLTVLDI